MSYIVSATVGYLLGSIPTAYILVKVFKKMDIRELGSGNVGALNAYEVTGSAVIGLTVLVVDILKGFFAVRISGYLFENDFMAMSLAGIFAVVGHNFSFWISFKGGRGLATSTGVFLVLNPSVIILWSILWLLAYARIKNVHAGNIWATFFTPVIVISTFKFFNRFTFQNPEGFKFAILIITVSIFVFIKHIGPLKELIKQGVLIKNKPHRKP